MMRNSHTTRFLITRFRRVRTNRNAIKFICANSKRSRVNRVHPVNATKCNMRISILRYILSICFLRTTQVDRSSCPSVILTPPQLRANRRQLSTLNFNLTFSTLHLCGGVEICRRVFRQLPTTCRVNPIRGISKDKQRFIRVRVGRIDIRGVGVKYRLLINVNNNINFTRRRICRIYCVLILIQGFRERMTCGTFHITRSTTNRIIRGVHFSTIKRANRSSRTTYINKVRGTINRKTMTRTMTIIMFTIRRVRRLFPTLFCDSSVNNITNANVFCSTLRRFNTMGVRRVTCIFTSSKRNNRGTTYSRMIKRVFRRYTSKRINIATRRSVLRLIRPKDRYLRTFHRITYHSQKRTSSITMSYFRRCRRVFFTFCSGRSKGNLFLRRRQVSTICIMKDT